MGKIKLLILAIIGAACAAIISTSTGAHAVSSPVEFIIPDTTLTVSGYASPGALVSIYDGGSIIGTAVAKSNARFSKTFVALDSGLHNLKLEYTDRSGRKSNSVTDQISVAFHKKTSVEYFLPPTFEIIPQKVNEGDLVTFRGSSVPGAQIEINVDGSNTVLRPQVNAAGNYSVTLATDGYYIGQHPASAKSTFGGKSSFETEKLMFEVLPLPSGQSNNDIYSDLRPPVITFPESPYLTDEEEIMLRGTAAPNQQIIIYVDGEPVGSTFTNADGQWFFNLRLYRLEQEIRAITCVNNECSDYSNLLIVKFTGEFGVCADLKFALADYRFWGIAAGNGVDVTLTQISGEEPYEMLIDWGDGVTERFNHSDDDGFKVHHVFNEAGKFNASITVKDELDCQLTRYFTVEVNEKELKFIDFWWTIPAIITVSFASLMRYNGKRF